jgi:hypothetical protein
MTRPAEPAQEDPVATGEVARRALAGAARRAAQRKVEPEAMGKAEARKAAMAKAETAKVGRAEVRS